MPTLRFYDVATRYHQQDQPDYCGEAVAQMILAQLGLLVPFQDELKRRVNAHGRTGLQPQDVATLLNDPRVGAGTAFAVQPDHTVQDGARRIFASLASGQTAVATSILRGSHWVAVSGAVYDASPRVPEILGFFIENPEPNAPGEPIAGNDAQPAPPHAENDTCGFGNGYGSPKTFVTLHEWFSLYWVTQSGADTFVTVPRGAATPPLLGSVARETNASAPGKPRTPAQLCTLAMAGIAQYGLAGRGSPLARRLAGATCIAPPILQVASMPQFKSLQSSEPFHIVKVQGGDGSVANVRIGANDGRFLSVETPASFIPLPEDLFDFASSALDRHEAEYGPLSESFVTGERRFTVHPTLVWRPCRQSMSPFQPLVQINLAGTIVFVTMDGSVHRRLEDHDGNPVSPCTSL